MKSNNILFRGVSGRLGNYILRQIDGKTVIALRPVPPIKNTQPMPALIQASKYAKRVLRKLEMHNLYALGINQKHTSAYRVAQSDFLNSPHIDELDLTKYEGHAGDRILIKTWDDFRIKEVNIKIETNDDILIETGLALPDTTADIFIYKCRCENMNLLMSYVLVESYDYAGNVTRCRVSIAGDQDLLE